MWHQLPSFSGFCRYFNDLLSQAAEFHYKELQWLSAESRDEGGTGVWMWMVNRNGSLQHSQNDQTLKGTILFMYHWYWGDHHLPSSFIVVIMLCYRAWMYIRLLLSRASISVQDYPPRIDPSPSDFPTFLRKVSGVLQMGGCQLSAVKWLNSITDGRASLSSLIDWQTSEDVHEATSVCHVCFVSVQHNDKRRRISFLTNRKSNKLFAHTHLVLTRSLKKRILFTASDQSLKYVYPEWVFLHLWDNIIIHFTAHLCFLFLVHPK